MYKFLIKIVVLSVINIRLLWSQYPVEEEYTNHYFTSLTSFYSGSGYPQGYTLNMGVQKGKKALFIGIIFHNNENHFAGSYIRYRIYLGKFEEPISYIKPFQPFFQYNLIYHKATVYENAIITKTGKIIEVKDNEPGKIATMEHYFTIGFKIKVVNSLYITPSLGTGIYIGSLSKIHKPNTIGIHGINEGLTIFFNVGLEYLIARQKKSIEI